MRTVQTFALSFTIIYTVAACALSAEFEPGYPSRPISIIVPYSEGGGMDIAARLIAKYAAPNLGQNIEVENIPHGGNVRGYQQAVEAPPDGYTLAAWANGLITDSLLVKTAPYRYTDVKPVCMFANDPHIIVVEKNFAREAGIEVLEDLFAYAREHPGIVSIGMGGNWTTHDFMRIKMERIGRVAFNRIPFLGGRPALQAVASGTCQIATPFVSELIGFADRRNLVPLAVAYSERVPQFPELASVAELGYPGMTQSIWRILALPKHTPEPIKRQLESGVRRAFENPEFIDEAESLGVNPFFMESDKLELFLEREFRFYSHKVRTWAAASVASQ